jgi:hypothetical protein
MDLNRLDTCSTTSPSVKNGAPMPSVDRHGNKTPLSQVMEDFEFRKMRVHIL